MNKTVIAVLLLGLVVVAMAAEGKDKSAKQEKMRMKKDKLMAKRQKEKMTMQKRKDMREGAVPVAKRGEALEVKDAFRQKYTDLMEQKDSLTSVEFKTAMRSLKEEMKRKAASGKSDARRNKRSTKEASKRKMKKDAFKKTAEKKRRSP